jgi:hypothetical protein
MQSFSEKDKGTFDAINRGFARATGDLYSWCDADNTYAQGAFAGLMSVVAAFPDIEWLKGFSSTMSEEGVHMYTRQGGIYRRDWLKEGIYGRDSYYVNADTVFWSASLWKRSGPIPIHYRCAGEQWLWMQMASFAPLWSVNLHITNYRKRRGQLSANTYCKEEQQQMRPRRSLNAWKARLFFSAQSRLYPKGEKLFLWLYPKLFMSGDEQYIDFENNIPVKKMSTTFIIGENPSYADISKKS